MNSINMDRQVSIIENGKKVLSKEMEGLKQLSKKIDRRFSEVVDLILSGKGKLIFTGIGKAGIIALKVSSTFSSLGRPSFFMHSAEAAHGDLGMVGKEDLVFIFSNSGNSKEITDLLPFIKNIGSTTIGITGNDESFLYKNVDYPLSYGKLEEACGFGLAPTTTTTAMLALGDALAVATLKEDEKFTERSFALNHPGGSLGKRLMQIKNGMRKGEEVVVMEGGSMVKNALVKMTAAKIGSVVVVKDEKVVGIFLDGDLRRSIEEENVLNQPIQNYMNTTPTLIHDDQLVEDALNIMATKKIGEIPVIDHQEKFCGVICLKDII